MFTTITYIASNGACIIDTRPEAEIVKSDEDYLIERATKEKMKKFKESNTLIRKVLRLLRKKVFAS